jgi:hypothetical protein
MGSPPTLDPDPTQQPGFDQPDRDHQLTSDQRELLEHLRTPAAMGGHEFQDWPAQAIVSGFGGDLQARHRHDHTHLPREFGHRHTDFYRPDPQREGEEVFDRLNPGYGVPADHHHPQAHRDLAQRERALALGVRVAVHDSRLNDPDPVIWQPGQDYRAADALQRARTQPTRARWGPERLGPER